MADHSKSLISFVNKSTTAFHAVEELKSDLLKNKYTPLNESESWTLKANSKYFVIREDASIIVFTSPKKINDKTSFNIIGAHTDSPCLKIKSNPISQKEGYQLLNIEIYGGVLLTSWFDKDLLIGGRVFTENKNGEIEKHLITLPYKVKIPRLAIHLDRGVNEEGFKVNAQTQMMPVLGLDDSINFETLLQKEINTKNKVLSTDLFLFDSEASCFGGFKDEFIYSPRMDNLAMVHASYEAITSQKNNENDFQVAVYFHNEEIGSNTQNGGDSNFLEATLKRVCGSFNLSESDFLQAMAKSYFISADMAHAVHPSYAEKHDPNHKPLMNRGPVIKSNANMRYATDGKTIAQFKQLCNKANVPFQDFCGRNDMGCGSTIGPMTASKLGICAVDVGNPMLSMHSIREMAGREDHTMMIKVFQEFYK
jgi:aspartyl aminopeptidase